MTIYLKYGSLTLLLKHLLYKFKCLCIAGKICKYISTHLISCSPQSLENFHKYQNAGELVQIILFYLIVIHQDFLQLRDQ